MAHFVYVSVAQPAPIMHAYIAVRQEGESAIGRAGLTATILRPWYVLGPEHWWPVALMPLYAAARLLPARVACSRSPRSAGRCRRAGAHGILPAYLAGLTI